MAFNLTVSLAPNITEIQQQQAKVLVDLDRALVSNIFIVLLELIGIVGSILAFSVVWRDASLRSNHYVLVQHLFVGVMLASYSFFGRTVLQLHETATRLPFLPSKLFCVCLFFKIGSPVWRYMHLVIQIDRIIALQWPLKYALFPRHYTHTMAGTVWLLAAAEQCWALYDGISTDVPHLTACQGRLMYSNTQIQFETNRDLTVAALNIVAAVTLAVLFEHGLYQARKSGKEVSGVRQLMEPKILKASAANACCFAVTIFLGAILRATVLNQLSADQVPLFTAYINPCYSALEASVVFMYYGLNSQFRSAFNRLICGRNSSSVGSVGSGCPIHISVASSGFVNVAPKFGSINQD